jgi:hypothetical protein
LGWRRWVGRAVGPSVHHDFCVVAICENGVVRSAGRVASIPEGISALGESLLSSDRVALEVTGSWWEVARMCRGIRRMGAVTRLGDASSLASPASRSGRLTYWWSGRT